MVDVTFTFYSIDAWWTYFFHYGPNSTMEHHVYGGSTHTHLELWRSLSFPSSPGSWLSPVIPIKIKRITSHRVISVDLFLIKMRISLEFLVRFNMSTFFLFCLYPHTKSVPSIFSVQGDLLASVPTSCQPCRDRCGASLLWGYMMYTLQHPSCTTWLFQGRNDDLKWTICIPSFGLLLSFLEVVKLQIQCITAA